MPFKNPVWQSLFFKWDCIHNVLTHLMSSWLWLVLFTCLFVFQTHHTACRILVPWPGNRHTPLVLEVQGLNHWASREVPAMVSFKFISFPFVCHSSSVFPIFIFWVDWFPYFCFLSHAGLWLISFCFVFYSFFGVYNAHL